MQHSTIILISSELKKKKKKKITLCKTVYRVGGRENKLLMMQNGLN